MSQQRAAAVDPAAVTASVTTEVGPAPNVPGIDPLDIPNLSEPQAFIYANAMNPHITRRYVRDSVLRGTLRGVRHGNKNLFSRRAVLTWMTGGAA